MRNARLVRIAVASDLHAYSGDAISPSHLNINMSEGLVCQHPIAGLLDLIATAGLNADVLLSPGDLGDKADLLGIGYAWNALERVSHALGCEVFTATAGNHDLDSRFNANDHDPSHILKGLLPAFPLQNEPLDNKYWARHYAIWESPPLKLVVLNSSAFHGFTEAEKNHGRIDSQTLQLLRKDLASGPPMPINVLLCHHHPHQHSELSLGEHDVMTQGQQLLDMLGSGALGRWLVIHGHKHHPKIAYAAGGASSPVVFAAGSLSAILTGQLQTAARNQFYIVDVDATLCAASGMVGSVRSWDWSAGIGWIESPWSQSGLPARFGFGTRQDCLSIANCVAAEAAASSAPLAWSQINALLPQTLYLLPQDLNEMVRLLKEQYQLEVTYRGSILNEVGRL